MMDTQEREIGFYMGIANNLSKGGPQIGAFGRDVLYGIFTDMPKSGRPATQDEVRMFADWTDTMIYSDLRPGDFVFMQDPYDADGQHASRAAVGYIATDPFSGDPGDGDGSTYKCVFLDGMDDMQRLTHNAESQVVVILRAPR